MVQLLLAKLSGNVGQAQPMRLRVRASGLKNRRAASIFSAACCSAVPTASWWLQHRSPGLAYLQFIQPGNCFIVLERERGNVEAGEWVEVEPFNHLFGGL